EQQERTALPTIHASLYFKKEIIIILLCVFNQAVDLVVQLSPALKTKPHVVDFGTVFTDHMLTVEWSVTEGWQAPFIRPLANLSLHPACSSLHYGIQLFEGFKVYRGDDSRLRLFRPMLNMSRMANSAKRACLPAFDQTELLECIRRLVEIDQDWVPRSDSASLYIRPTFISTEPSLGVKRPGRALLYVILCQAGSYFNSEADAISLWADPKYTRAWKGGTGDCKMGGLHNSPQNQVLHQRVQENISKKLIFLLFLIISNNVFLFLIEEELATPPLDGIILPGITRRSILELTRKWGEFKVTERYLTMSQLCSALKQQQVKEMFGSGTACMICPIGHIVYLGEVLQDGSTVSFCLHQILTLPSNDIFPVFCYFF
uniref:branched-chain-amino-acid transaminase n=1 Tax=Oreochromis aureus TaxID=47969 RepID=A0A668VS79_OREAU